MDAEAEPKLEVSRAGETLRYATTILAPDPCHSVDPASEVARAGDTVTVRRRLVREPGPCAAVMSPLTVAGEVDGPRARVLVLEIYTATGRLASTFTAPLAPSP